MKILEWIITACLLMLVVWSIVITLGLFGIVILNIVSFKSI
jgi:hypothetical protein